MLQRTPSDLAYPRFHHTTVSVTKMALNFALVTIDRGGKPFPLLRISLFLKKTFFPTNVTAHKKKTGGLQPSVRQDLPLRLFVTANVLIAQLDGRGIRPRFIFFFFLLFPLSCLQRAPRLSRRPRLLLSAPHHDPH